MGSRLRCRQFPLDLIALDLQVRAGLVAIVALVGVLVGVVGLVRVFVRLSNVVRSVPGLGHSLDSAHVAAELLGNSLQCGQRSIRGMGIGV